MNISIRKTFIKDKNGKPLDFFVGDLADFRQLSSHRNDLLNENRSLQNLINKSETECQELNNANHELSIKLEKAKIELIAVMKAKSNSEKKLSDKEFELEILKKEITKVNTEKMLLIRKARLMKKKLLT